MDSKNNPHRDSDSESYAVKLHFQLVEAKMDDVKEEIKEIKDNLKEHKSEFHARLDKLDNKIWGIIVLLPTSAGVVGSDIISTFLG